MTLTALGAAMRACARLACLITLLVACADGSPPTDADEQPEVGATTSALAEGRTIRMVAYSASGNRPTTASAVDMGRVLGTICGFTATYDPPTGFKRIEGGQALLQGACEADTTSWNGSSQPLFTNVDGAAWGHLCAGQLALQVATAVGLRYVVMRDNRMMLADEPVASGGEAQPGTSTLFEFSERDSNQSATWALIAADHFRDASNLYSRALTTCGEDKLTALFPQKRLGVDTQIPLIEAIVANQADALSSMVTAAETATKFIAAASDAKQAGGDPVQSKIDAWLGRFDSRIEAANVYAPVHAGMYAPKLVPIFEMYNASTKAYYYTAKADRPRAGFARSTINGKLAPAIGYGLEVRAGAEWPRMAGRLRTWTRTSPAEQRSSLDSPGSGWTAVSTDADHAFAWGASQRHLTLTSLELWQTTASGAKSYRWWPKGSAPPSATGTGAPGTGWALVSPTQSLFVFPYSTGAADFPIVTARPTSQGALRVLELLRILRIDPREGVVVNSSARLPADITEDLRRAMNEDYGLYGDLTAVAMLDALNAKQADIDVAARYLVEEARTLGRAIIDDSTFNRTSGKSKRVWGTQESMQPTHPAILYARTAGYRASIPYVQPAGTGDPMPGFVYAASSITAALDYARGVLSDEYGNPKVPPTFSSAAATMMKGALQFVNAHLGPRTRLGFSRGTQTDGTIDAVRINLQRVGYASSEIAKAKSEIQIWLGEAGLECAMHGSVYGQTCSESTHAFSETAGGSALDWSFNSDQNELVINIHKSQAPAGGTIRVDVPIFVTRKQRGGLDVLTAFYPEPYTDFSWYHMPPFGPWVADGLSNLLAADPANAADADVNCVGLKNRVALEDELMEGQSGADGVETSFSYYLKAARDAADLADRLGGDLVEQGLQMDIRSEIARAELEDQCGGVVNLKSLSQTACAQNDCDILETLKSSSDATDDNASLAACLNAEGSTKDVSLGSGIMCAFYVKTNGKRGRPCEGDYPQQDAEATKPECPALLDGMKDVNGTPNDFADDVPMVCSDLFPASTNPNIEIDELERLDMVPSFELDPTTTTAGCAQLLQFIANDKHGQNWSFDYSEQQQLYEIARAVGADYDDLGRLTVTRKGAPWLEVQEATAMNVAVREFPCAPIDAADWGLSKNQITALCGAVPAGQRKPLFCGLSCESHLLPSVNQRLENAVLALRHLSGAGLDGVHHSIETLGLANQSIWYKNYDLEQIWPRELAFYGYFGTQYIYPEFPATPGPLSLFTELAAMVGHPLSARSSDNRNDQPFEMRADFAEMSYGLATSIDGQRIEPATFSFKGSLAEGAQGRMACETQCEPRIVLDGHIRNMIEKNRGEMDGSPSRLIVDWGDVAAGSVSKFWTKIPAKAWNSGQRKEKLERIENRKVFEVDGAAPIVPDAIGFPKRYQAELSVSTMYDVLTLACMAQHPPEDNVPSCAQLEEQVGDGNLTVDGLRDYGRVSRALQCKANELLKYASAQTFMDVPGDIVDAIKSNSVANVYPKNQGEMASAVTNFMTALNGIADNVQSMARIVNNSSRAVAQAENQLRMLGYQYEVNVENAAAAIAQQETNCAIAKINAIPDVSVSLGGNPSVSFSPTAVIKNGLMAKANCSNADVQKAHLKNIQNLQGDINLAEEIGVLQGLQQTLSDLNAQLDETNRAFLTQHAIVQSSVANIASIRAKAVRAAATALLLDNDDVGHEFNASTTMRARYNTLQARYDDALVSAKKLAYLARRALEQKVGMDMATMTEDLPLVDAPASWVNKLCSLRGIDPEDIRSNMGEDDTSNDDNGYAEQYIGDYVTRLENFLKSYSLQYPFTAGENLTVVSVRDEIARSRVQCDLEGWNELLYTDGASFGAPERRDESWTPTCSEEAGRRAWLSAGGSGPFQCASEASLSETTAMLCNDLGGAQAFALSSVATDSCSGDEQQDEPIPTEPPTEGLAYWISADACTETTPGSGVMANCADLSGNGRNLTGSANIVVNGIGGRTSLRAFSYVNVTKTPTATDRYTISYVVRPLNSGLLWSATETLGDGTTRTANINVASDAAMSFTYQAGAPTVLPSTTLSVNMGAAPAGLSNVGHIVTVRARGLDGVEIFIDGKLRTASAAAAYPMKLGERVALGGVSTPMMFAETLAYMRDLDDDELNSMHRYLADRYEVDTRAPDGWLDLDDVHVIRTAGSSPASGLSGTATSLVDRAANRNITALGSPAALVPFAGTHRAFPFDGIDDSLNWSLLAGSTQRPSAGGTPTALPRAHIDEYAVTIVGQYANLARQHVLYSTGGNVRVVADGTTQSAAIRVVNGAVTETYAAPAGALPADLPFVITLRASRSRSATELFINGVRQASWAGFEYEVDPRAIGRRGGATDILRGSIAEVRVHARDLSNGNVSALHAELGEKFGIDVTSVGEGGEVSATGPARVRQWVPVLGGMNYIVSWYQPKSDAALLPVFDLPDGSTVVSSTPACRASCSLPDGMTLACAANQPCEEELHPNWVRRHTSVAIDGDGWMAVGFPAPAAGMSQLFAAPQVEMISGQSAGPATFFPTDDDRAKPVGICEDTDGETFRRMWRRGCEYYCPPGTGNDCARGTGNVGLAQRCFRELSFSLMLEDIEHEKLLKEAGFAVGNFNYRFNELAVNIVGNVKNCELSSAPSACYANNHFAYSLRHEGPYRIRNHVGDVYRAPLYPGNIQQSNAMATDRYLTNPLSSADKGMLEDFWDAEFKGRPIDGNYTLRVYESDSMDWEALRDIQIALRYRHWTRAE